MPGVDNTFADALSREERRTDTTEDQGTVKESEQQSEEDDHILGRHLAAGDVEATPPQGKQ